MSQVFGDIRQLAFIVKDIDSAMDYWARVLGIGPFFIKREIQFKDYEYRGKKGFSPTVSIALANSGFLQIELIAQHDDVASIYKEFLDSGQSGLQHVSSWLTSKALKEKTTLLLAQNYSIAQQCSIASSGVQLVYFECLDNPNNFMFEMSDLKEPGHYERVMGIKDAAQNWDGQKVTVEVLN